MRKKVTVLVCALALAVGLFFGANALNGTMVAKADEVGAETGSFGTEVPENWELYQQCDVSHTTTTFSDGNMVIKHANANISNAQYYGGVYLIETGKAYGDFEFSVTVKMTEPADGSRWFGVMYHTQNLAGNIAGYLMNYRYNGTTASSAVTSARGFHDDATNSGPALSDGGWHTMKITMTGSTAKHYMDDELIKEWDVTTKNSVLGGEYSVGGFAIIVNRCTLSIKDYTIDGEEKAVAVSDDTFVSTYSSSKIKVKAAPTVVLDVKSSTELTSIASLGTTDARPSNAILRFDTDYNVTDTEGVVLGSFKDIYTNSLKGKIIPILYLKGDAEANAAITFFKEELDILDIAVMSGDPAVVKKVREANTKIRGIIVYGDDVAPYDIVKTNNMNYANVAVISEQAATREKIRYIQARFKTVWVNTASATEQSLVKSAVSEAYGIITTDFNAAYTLYQELPKNALLRAPYNVAHRGLPNKCNENSVSGVRAALASGATHVELDGYLTTDNEIVLMHNTTIDEATNGTGSVESFSLQQLRQYKLDWFAPEDIPTLQDVLDVIKGTDLILVFEIKSYKPAIIDKLKAILDEYNCYDQVVVITFATAQLPLMKEKMPQVPTANLNTVSTSSFPGDLYWIGSYNAGIDTNYGSVNQKLNENCLRDRGLTGWYWTYNGRAALNTATSAGYLGLTNNDADAYMNDYEYVTGAGSKAKGLQVGDTVPVKATTYAGRTDTVDGTVFKCYEYDDHWEVVASYYSNNRTYYTELYSVSKSSGNGSRGNGGCSSCAGGSAMIGLIAALGAMFVARIRFR